MTTRPTIYASYPELEVGRVFTPAEVTLLAYVSPEKQRQDRKAGITKFLPKRAEGETAHTRYEWEDVVLWGLYKEVAQIGFDLESAGYFAASFSGLPNVSGLGGSKPERRQILYHDFRLSNEGRKQPLYMFCWPQLGKPETFTNTMTGSGKVDLDGNAFTGGRFGFWLNYSDFQRRLLSRYEMLREEGALD